jgi:hypothetical protein
MKLIANTILASSRRPTVYDISGAEQTSDAYYNLTEGPLHLKWTGSSAATRHIVYEQGSGRPDFDIDSAVLVTAGNITGRGVRLYGWPSFSTFGTKSFLWDKLSITSSYFNGDGDTRFLVMQNTDAESSRSDWSTGFDAVSCCLWGAYTWEARKVFFGKSIDLGRPSLVREPLSKEAKVVKRQCLYQATDRLQLQFNEIDQSTIDTLINVRQFSERPFFLYDEDGEWLPEKCGYFICDTKQTEQRRDDTYYLRLDVLKVRHV